jgi:predicted negative regulator of RcsB-dependent stress response
MTEEYLTDDEQLEEVKRLAQEYAPWVVPAIILGLGFVVGFRYYHSHQEQRALSASSAFSRMNAAIQSNDRAKAHRLADALVKDYPKSPYADQAQLAVASLYIDDGEDANAIAPLTAVAEHSSDAELRHVARLRLARVQIDQNKPDDALKTLSDDPGAFAAAYSEVRGDAYYAKNDLPKAAEAYKAALAAGAVESVDSGLLALKIADLGLPQTPSVPAPGSTPGPVPGSATGGAAPPTASVPGPTGKAKP